MSIRLKLIITYIFCVLISTAVIVISIFAGTTRFMGKVAEEIIENSAIDEAVLEVIDILAEIKQAQDYNEELLLDKDYLIEIDDRLGFFNTGLVVFYNDEFINLTDIPSGNELYDNLSLSLSSQDRTEGFNTNVQNNEDAGIEKTRLKSRSNERINSFELDGKSYSFFDYTFTVDEELLVYFFITDITGVKSINTTIMNGVMGAVLVLVILMILPIILLIQKDIIKPLKSLNYGSNEIIKGNLDFKLKVKSKNEVGKVIHSYEKMRIELKKSIEKQVEFENSRKELISSISHDLKTPMTSIKGYVEGILDGVANTEEKRDRYLKVIYQKSIDMDKLIDDLFIFSKLDLKKFPFEFRVTKMEKFIRDISEEIKMEYEEEAIINLTVINNSDMEALANIDVQQMKRAINNLVQNSVKYNESEHKQIAITYTNNNDDVSITIADNGIGMTEEELKKAFDMFYRSDDSRNTKTGGSGLGLAIVKQIILEHKGTINAKSSKTKGTSITVKLGKYNNIKGLANGKSIN